MRWPLVTIAAMLAIAYTTRFSGMDATMGLAMTKTGAIYPFFAALLGWLGVALTGSDTASNAMFGGLQVVTATKLAEAGVLPLDPGRAAILLAAANSTGGVMGKMIDAQSIVVAGAATGQTGQEGAVLRFVFGTQRRAGGAGRDCSSCCRRTSGRRRSRERKSVAAGRGRCTLGIHLDGRCHAHHPPSRDCAPGPRGERAARRGRPAPAQRALHPRGRPAPDLGCYGGAAKTPALDALAKRGVRFDAAYCQQAVCNPSRSSFLTGKRPDALRLWDNGTHFRDKNPDVMTLPLWFKERGYATRNVGKIFHNWHTKVKGDRRSWSADEFLHYAQHGDDMPQVKGELPPNRALPYGRDYGTVPLCECRDVADEAYYDGRVAAEAVRVLEEVKDKPFFLAVGFWKPHAPFNAPRNTGTSTIAPSCRRSTRPGRRARRMSRSTTAAKSSASRRSRSRPLRSRSPRSGTVTSPTSATWTRRSARCWLRSTGTGSPTTR